MSELTFQLKVFDEWPHQTTLLVPVCDDLPRPNYYAQIRVQSCRLPLKDHPRLKSYLEIRYAFVLYDPHGNEVFGYTPIPYDYVSQAEAVEAATVRLTSLCNAQRHPNQALAHAIERACV